MQLKHVKIFFAGVSELKAASYTEGSKRNSLPKEAGFVFRLLNKYR